MKTSEAMNALIADLRKRFPHLCITNNEAELIKIGFLAGEAHQMKRQTRKMEQQLGHKHDRHTH